MSVQLMHVQHYATNVVQRKVLFQTVSRWIDERIRADGELCADTRNDPGSVNLLHNILIDDEPTATDRDTALAFAALVERFASKSPLDQVAIAALEIAEGIRYLANEHEVLHLTLA